MTTAIISIAFAIIGFGIGLYTNFNVENHALVYLPLEDNSSTIPFYLGDTINLNLE